MRTLKTFALLTALTCSAAFAVDSMPTGYGSANTTVTASGTYASAVSFTVPSASLNIPTPQVRPGASFTVTVPVTNTTDRSITVSAGTIGKPGNATVVPTVGTASIASGATGNLMYTITFDTDSAQAATLTGTADFSFQVLATDTAATPGNLSY